MAAVLSIAALSCSASGPASSDLVSVPSTPPTLQVDVGTGATDFVELADGAPVELVHGGQGGFHIWTAIRVHDERFSVVQVNLSTQFTDGTSAGMESSTVTTLGEPLEGARSAAGLRNFIASGSAAAGKRVVLRVEVIAKDGQHGSAERVITVAAK